MRRLLAAALAVLLYAVPVLLPGSAGAQDATPPAVSEPAPVVQQPAFDYFPLVVAAGAVAGVVGFNVLALGLEALPGGLAYAAPAAVVPAEMSVAMSRVYATVAAATGGAIAYYLYAP